MNSPTTRYPSVLITGGTGFIGSALVRQWLEHESDFVVNLDKLTYAGVEASLSGFETHPRYAFVRGDIAEPLCVAALLAKYRPQTVIHLAAESHVDRSIAEPPLFAQTNVVGTSVLLDQATRYWQTLEEDVKQGFRFVLISTDEVFGSAGPEDRFTIDSPLKPSSPYAASKAAGEQMAAAFARTYGLPVVTINPTNNYGPRQLPEKLIPKMVLAAAAGEPLPLYGDGQQQRDWLHVDDCCNAIRAAAQQGVPGQRYLVGSGVSRTNREVVAIVRNCVGNEAVRIVSVADRPGHDQRYAVETDPTCQQLGWKPQIDFETGLAEAVAWYLEHAEWVSAAQESLARRPWCRTAQ